LLSGAPVTAMPALSSTVEAIAGQLQERREFAMQRSRVIAANAELQERELIKLAALSAAVAGALRERGVGDPAASLTAEVAIGVFKVAFERWVDEANQRTFPELVRQSVDELAALTAVGRSAAPVAQP
jgi:transcriptional regulator MftR-like protein